MSYFHGARLDNKWTAIQFLKSDSFQLSYHSWGPALAKVSVQASILQRTIAKIMSCPEHFLETPARSHTMEKQHNPFCDICERHKTIMCRYDRGGYTCRWELGKDFACLLMVIEVIHVAFINRWSILVCETLIRSGVLLGLSCCWVVA